MRQYIEKKNVFQLFPETKIEFECGIEKEMLLIAINKKDKQLYNLNLAYDVVERVDFFVNRDHKLGELFSNGWSITKEYSKCLLEIISPPYQKDSVKLLLNDVGYIHRTLNKYLPKFLHEFYPRIYESFHCSLVAKGTSEVYKYIDKNLMETDDMSFPEYNVLSENIDFVLNNKHVLIDMNGHEEPAIGIYNHLSSLHVTFHPTYMESKVKNIERYLDLIGILPNIVESFKYLDVGNRKVMRNGKFIILGENLRDMFLGILAKKIHKQPRKIRLKNQTGMTHEQRKVSFLDYISKVRKNNSEGIDTYDQLFKNWHCADVRPRFIDNNLPGFEIRAFGSNFTEKNTNLLLEYLISLDAVLSQNDE